MNTIKTNKTKYQPRMAPNQPDELNIRRTICLSLGFMSVLAGLGYYNLAVPLLLGDIQQGLAPGDISWFGIFGQQTIIGTILVLDNIIALLMQPYFAALSDRAKSKYIAFDAVAFIPVAVAPPPGGIVVDDADSGFVTHGTPGNWHTAPPEAGIYYAGQTH